MNTKTKRESFPVLSVSREDVNYALGLALDREFGTGLSDTNMTTIAKRLGEAHAELGAWDILRDVMDILEVNHG